MESENSLVKETILEEAIKRMGLKISDMISTKLKILFTCKYYGKKLVPYDAVQRLDRKYYTFSLNNELNKPCLNIMDVNIIYMLTNRILGGEGIVEIRKFKELFTFSENYFGKMFIEWIVEALRLNGINMELGKIADSPKYYHIYLPEEKVWQFTFEVYLGQQNIGMYYICFDGNYEIKQDVQKE